MGRPSVVARGRPKMAGDVKALQGAYPTSPVFTSARKKMGDLQPLCGAGSTSPGRRPYGEAMSGDAPPLGDVIVIVN